MGTRSPSYGAAAAASLFLLASGCAHPQPQRPPSATPYVATTVATTGTIHPAQQIPGIIAPFQNVAVQSTLTEPADSVNVNEGDRVTKGEVLAELDTADLQAQLQADLATAASDSASTSHNVYAGSLSIAQAQDQLRSAQTAARQAQANLNRDTLDLNRYRQLIANGYVSQQQYDQQATTVRNDQQALRSALATVSSNQSAVAANGSLQGSGLQSSTVAQSRATEQVALAQAQQIRVQISKATIVSPIDGVVVNRNLNPGEYPGTRQIFTLQQVNPVYAILRGSESQVAHVAAGVPAVILASDLNNSHYRGKVVGVLNQIAPGSTNFSVKVVVPNTAGRLRPGMAVVGNVDLPGLHGVRVPVTAFIDDNHTSLMTVSRSGMVKTVNVVETGEDGSTSIVSGLKAGMRVISDGQTSVGDGEKVAVR